MNKLLVAILAFAIVFVGVFYVIGTYVMPHLPPINEIPQKVGQPEFWTSNWAAVLAGLVVGVIAAFPIMKCKPKLKKAK
jgi:ABC-type branched-subunit amino acid transport system permease subunit